MSGVAIFINMKALLQMATTIPDFLVDSENRINKLWELCIYTPMDLETKNYILNQNDIFKRYETLLNYVESVLNS